MTHILRCFKITLVKTLVTVTLRTSSVTFVVLIAGLCAVTLLGLLLLVCRVKALGRKQRLQVRPNFKDRKVMRIDPVKCNRHELAFCRPRRIWIRILMTTVWEAAQKVLPTRSRLRRRPTRLRG